MIELESVKTRISAPAHPSATGGRVSGLVLLLVLHFLLLSFVLPFLVLCRSHFEFTFADVTNWYRKIRFRCHGRPRL